MTFTIDLDQFHELLQPAVIVPVMVVAYYMAAGLFFRWWWPVEQDDFDKAFSRASCWFASPAILLVCSCVAVLGFLVWILSTGITLPPWTKKFWDTKS